MITAVGSSPKQFSVTFVYTFVYTVVVRENMLQVKTFEHVL